MKIPAPSILAIGILATLGPHAASAFDLQGTVWAEASKKTCNLDPRLLYAVALNESKRYAGKVVTPNPYALNISDKGYHPASKSEAVQLLSNGLLSTKSIAVGAMQVSVRWNGHRVSHPTDLLELRTNVFIGSEILCEMIKGQDDMALAIGRYYTPNPKLAHEARHYGENVLRIWRRLILLSEA